MKTIGDVIRWLKNGVEWSDEASRDAAVEAISVLEQHEKASKDADRRLTEALSNPVFED